MYDGVSISLCSTWWFISFKLVGLIELVIVDPKILISGSTSDLVNNNYTTIIVFIYYI